NDAYRGVSGEREIIGRPFREVFPDGALSLLDEVYASGRPQVLHDFRGRWGHQAESNRYADVSLQPLPGPQGVAGISILAVDVTEAVRAREELAKLATEQLAMFDLVPSGIIVLDPTGAVVKANRAMRALLGSGPFADVTAETARRYRVRDEATGREFRSIEETLARAFAGDAFRDLRDRKSTRLNSSHVAISYAVFCLKKKKTEYMIN